MRYETVTTLRYFENVTACVMVRRNRRLGFGCDLSILRLDPNSITQLVTLYASWASWLGAKLKVANPNLEQASFSRKVISIS